MNTMKEYYAKRAAEYEDIYLKPERQEDLFQLKAILSGAFSGRDVRKPPAEPAIGLNFLQRQRDPFWQQT